ncbi:MAG: motility protein A [Spirochaetales bacterium]|nr:motility protein A [Spirochaetales bacterium]
MDLATIIGLILGVIAVIIGMAGGGTSPIIYVSLSSFLITVGGSFGAIMIANPMSRVLDMLKFFAIIFRKQEHGELKLIQNLVSFSEKARRDGILALEDDLESVDDDFLRKGIQLVVDGTDPDIIKNVLNTELNKIRDRHDDGIKLFDTWGKLAPAFGMIGTLIGLIAMLTKIEDRSAIGSGMSIALVTTLYGAFLANILFIPIKNKLEDKDKEESLIKEIMIEGILSIQSGDNPRILEEKLLSYLPTDKREAIQQESMRE